jgi:hypothetical protein
MTFDCRAVRYQYTAGRSMYFPPGKAGNMLRGAFGMLPDSGPVFTPRAANPSGLKDPPRPFVFRAEHLEGRTVAPGEKFDFLVHLFDDRIPPELFGAIWRDRATLENIESRDVHIELQPSAAHTAKVRFITPTELKPSGKPEFSVLFARVRDRVSTLSALYGPGPLAIDFRGLGARAADIRMTRCLLHNHQFERTSTRTGQTHGLGGFTGEAFFEGELDDFAPFLRAAELTGVGRHTVWGKGAITVAIS